MLRVVKLNRGTQNRIFCCFITILVCLGYLWLMSSGLLLQVNTAIISRDTELLQADMSKVKVEHIGADENIRLSNTKTIEGSTIERYVKVAKGTGTWYIEDGNILAVELTNKDIKSMSYRFLVLDPIIYIILLIFSVKYSLCVGGKFYLRVCGVFLWVSSQVFYYVVALCSLVPLVPTAEKYIRIYVAIKAFICIGVFLTMYFRRKAEKKL